MYDFAQLTWKKDNGITKLKQLTGGFRLLGTEIKERKDVQTLNAEVVQDFIVTLHYKLPLWSKRATKKVHQKDVVARLICETAPYKASPEGQWGVNPISALRSA